MKAIFLPALMLLSSWATALENSLVMRRPGSQTSGVYAVVSPSTGNVTLYSLEGNLTTRYGSANFLADLQKVESYPALEREGVTYSLLRLSHQLSEPMPDVLINSPAFPDKPTAKEAAAGLKSLRARVIEAENTFWETVKPYDGVVRGAMGNQYLLLCVPGKHALLAYDCQDRDKGPVFVSYRNYGIDLMIPQVLNSVPAPQALMSALPADIKAEQKDAIEKAMKELAEGGGTIALQPSDPWIATGTLDRWVLVDPPNKHICTYEYFGKKWKLTSSRNLDVDHLIPSSFSSAPNEQVQFTEYVKSRAKLLAAAGIVADMAYFKALVDQKQVASAKTSEIQADLVNDDLMLDFVKLRKIYAYRLNGANNGLEFLSMRDYTLDVGLALQDVEFRAAGEAVEAWEGAKKFLTKHLYVSAMRAVIYALRMDPSIYKKIDKDSSTKPLKKLPEWQPALDEAIKKAEEQASQRDERIKAAEEARKAKQPKK